MSKMMKCQLCTKYTTDIEADDRNFNSGRCMCGGELKEVMTDYKNELEQILEHHWNAALSCVAELNEGNWSEEEYLKAQANYRKHDLKAIEALLSQHSKKRELEARIDEIQRFVAAGGKYGWGETLATDVKYIDDRINQLGGQDESSR